MPGRSRPSSPLALVVLALVSEAPLHPYRLQQRIRERGMNKIANVARPNSVYQAMAGLHRAGLVSVRETGRDHGRPERTVYAITGAGRATLKQWLLAMLATPEADFPDFPAALALLPLLGPEQVLWQLQARARVLEERLAAAAVPRAEIPRPFRIDEEYGQTIAAAELNWLGSVIDDLRSGRLAWSDSTPPA
jgi:DNA-binding PadR family transcriptional regulator